MILKSVMTKGFKPYLLNKEDRMEIIAAVVIFGLVIAGMSVGYIFMNKPIAGSCGGLNNLDGEGKIVVSVACCRGQMLKASQSIIFKYYV